MWCNYLHTFENFKYFLEILGTRLKLGEPSFPPSLQISLQIFTLANILFLTLGFEYFIAISARSNSRFAISRKRNYAGGYFLIGGIIRFFINLGPRSRGEYAWNNDGHA